MSLSWSLHKGDLPPFQLISIQNCHVRGFVKRIVGVPGDRVAFNGAHLFVNDVARTGTPGAGEFVDHEGRRLRVLPETLDGREYQILDSEEISLPISAP